MAPTSTVQGVLPLGGEDLHRYAAPTPSRRFVQLDVDALHTVADTSGVGDDAAWVLVWLVLLADPATGRLTRTVDELAAELGGRRQRVRALLEELVVAGLARWVRPPGRGPGPGVLELTVYDRLALGGRHTGGSYVQLVVHDLADHCDRQQLTLTGRLALLQALVAADRSGRLGAGISEAARRAGWSRGQMHRYCLLDGPLRGSLAREADGSVRVVVHPRLVRASTGAPASRARDRDGSTSTFAATGSPQARDRDGSTSTFAMTGSPQARDPDGSARDPDGSARDPDGSTSQNSRTSFTEVHTFLGPCLDDQHGSPRKEGASSTEAAEIVSELGRRLTASGIAHDLAATHNAGARRQLIAAVDQLLVTGWSTTEVIDRLGQGIGPDTRSAMAVVLGSRARPLLNEPVPTAALDPTQLRQRQLEAARAFASNRALVQGYDPVDLVEELGAHDDVELAAVACTAFEEARGRLAS